MTTLETPETPEAAAPRTAADALDAAREHLLLLQSPEGWWKGELRTNVTMDAEDLLLREFLGIRTGEDTREAARWIRSRQSPDGTWANFHDGPPDLSTTVEAYVALRLAGDLPDAGHMARAAAYIRGEGGLPATRVFTRFWLAMFGRWPWDELPVVPPEMVFLPRWFPLNVYDFACWARQTIVPLSVVGALRPVRPLPFGLDELVPDYRLPRPGRRGLPGWGEAFGALDRALHVYQRRPLRGLQEAALRRAAEWIVARQERDGSWGGIQPPWVYSLLALHLLGYGLDHPVIQRGLDGLERFTIRDEQGRRLEACQSPVWDTALAMNALADAGLPAGHPALERAARWLVGEEVRGPGDWSVRRPGLPRRRGGVPLRGLLAALLLIVGTWAGALIAVFAAANRDGARPATAIIVLGAAQYDGRPSPVLRARLDHAIALWHRGLAPHLIVTGGRREGDRTSEAATGRRYAVRALGG